MEFSILNLLLVLLAAWLAGLLVQRLGYPSIFGELLAGILLGPPLLGFLQSSEALDVLAEVGVLLMMLYIGMEVDPAELFKSSWAGLLAALGGFITPFILAYFVVVWFGGSVAAGLFVGIAAGVTSLATKSRILVDLKLLDTRIAHVLMAGALVADTLSLIVFAAIVGVFDGTGFNAGEVVQVAIRAVLFFGVTMGIGLKVFPYVWARLRGAGLTGRTFNATLILLIALLFAELAELAGLHAILGAFIAGLFLREGTVLERNLAADLNHLVHDVSIGFLAPIFFVTAGFQITLNVFRTDLALLIAVIAVATIGKIAGTALFYLPSGNGWREGLVVGAGMNGRGAVEIIIAQIGLEAGLITPTIFSILVFMAIATTATVPLFLKWGTDWLRSRGELVRSQDDREGVIILGTGPTARALARLLHPQTPVQLVDNNWASTRSTEEEGLPVTHGNALDADVLSEAGAASARSFLALTPNPEVNVLAGHLARTAFNIPEVFVLLPEGNIAYHQDLLEQSRAVPLPPEAGAPLEHAPEGTLSGLEPVETQIEEMIEASEFLEHLEQQPGAYPMLVMNGDNRRPFMTVDTLEAGDTVVLLAPNGWRSEKVAEAS